MFHFLLLGLCVVIGHFVVAKCEIHEPNLIGVLVVGAMVLVVGYCKDNI